MACGLVDASHYLKQCWNIVNWTLGNKFQWNLNENLYIFILEGAFENVMKLAAILSRSQCVNTGLEDLVMMCSEPGLPAARAVLQCD